MAGIDITKLATTSPEKEGLLNKISTVLNKDISFSGNRFSDKKKEEFYLELGILLSAGVDIKSTLELIADEQGNKNDKLVILNIKECVVNGHTFSEAIRKAKFFTPYEYYSLQIGEESGKLGVVLKELAQYFKKKIKQKRQFVSALTYPAIVLSASMGAVLFMLNFIVPMFADIFARFGGDLPWFTKVILKLSNMIQSYFWLFFAVVSIGTYTLYRQRRKEWYRKMASRFILKLPFFGEIIRKIYLARFCSSMALLMASKLPLLKAITLVKQMIGFYPIEYSLDKIESMIVKGDPLYISLQHFEIFPKRMISLLKVGEEVNHLEDFFEKIASQYTEDVEHQTSMISSMIEPFMIIFLGLVVGIILIAMYLPLFNLSNTI